MPTKGSEYFGLQLYVTIELLCGLSTSTFLANNSSRIELRIYIELPKHIRCQQVHYICKRSLEQSAPRIRPQTHQRQTQANTSTKRTRPHPILEPTNAACEPKPRKVLHVEKSPHPPQANLSQQQHHITRPEGKKHNAPCSVCTEEVDSRRFRGTGIPAGLINGISETLSSSYPPPSHHEPGASRPQPPSALPSSSSSPSSRSRIIYYRSNPTLNMNSLTTDAERERLRDREIYARQRRYSLGPSTPSSLPFLSAPPPTPYSERGGSGLSTSSAWSWISWLGAAFVVVIGVVLLGAKEDDTSSRRMDDDGSFSGSVSGSGAMWRLLGYLLCIVGLALLVLVVYGAVTVGLEVLAGKDGEGVVDEEESDWGSPVDGQQYANSPYGREHVYEGRQEQVHKMEEVRRVPLSGLDRWA